MSDNLILIISIAVFIVVFIAVLRSKVKFRGIIEDFEAELDPTNLNDYARSGRGEVERELYSDGNAALKLRFSGTLLPEGSTVSLVINGYKIDDFQVFEGRVYEKIETSSGRTIPSVKTGDRVEVLFENTAILAGTFYQD